MSESAVQRFRLNEIPNGTDLLHKFPELAEIPEFSAYRNPDRNYLIRYIIHLYDPSSDLIKKNTDLNRRKEAAATLAGYERDLKTGKFKSKNIYKVMEMAGDIEANEDKKIEEYKSANPLIFAYLRFVSNMLWSEICINEQLFYEYTGLMLEAIEGRDSKIVLDAAALKTKLRPELSIIRTHIKALYKEFFGETDASEAIEKVKPFKPETIKI